VSALAEWRPTDPCVGKRGERAVTEHAASDAIWYFDFVSPFAYLQLPKLRKWRERITIRPQPIVFAAVLEHHGQLGPAEIPGKREFTYRMAQWRAQSDGVRLRFPPAHPFNPIAALRLAIACASAWPVIDALFERIWADGERSDDAASLDALATRFGIVDVASAIATPAVRLALRANTDAAIATGVYGVPSLRIGDCLFWGSDAGGMIDDYLDDPTLFDTGEYARIAILPETARRSR
jgi:2-hydroxychromene-2-carboxylate isomerase